MLSTNPVGQHLIIVGVCLFFLGLLQGVSIPFCRNPRMALAGHLTAVQCGIALMLFGMLWPLVELSDPLAALASYGFTLGFILIWFGITIASWTGASEVLPIAGRGYSGTRAAENTVKVFEFIGVTLSLIACVILLFGLL